jgi:hypothetical protein
MEPIRGSPTRTLVAQSLRDSGWSQDPSFSHSRSRPCPWIIMLKRIVVAIPTSGFARDLYRGHHSLDRQAASHWSQPVTADFLMAIFSMDGEEHRKQRVGLQCWSISRGRWKRRNLPRIRMTISSMKTSMSYERSIRKTAVYVRGWLEAPASHLSFRRVSVGRSSELLE